MKIDRELLQKCSEEDAAAALYETGKTLRGANLKKSSWLLIANGLRVQRISAILLQRLEAARTREDALRVLRIARKWVRIRKGSKSAHRQGPQENPLAVAAETSPEKYKEDEMEQLWEIDMDMELWGNYEQTYQEWLAEQADSKRNGHTRQPGLRATSALQDRIDQYAWERLPVMEPHFEDLRSRLDDKMYNQMVALSHHIPGLDLSEAELDFLRRHHLNALLQYVEDPQPGLSLDPIRDGFALAGLRMIEDRTGPKEHPFPVDWNAVAAWLAENLVLPPQAESVIPVIASAYAFFRKAPAPLLADLIRGSSAWQREWRSLLWYALPRTADLLPERAFKPDQTPGWWNQNTPQVNDPHWERVLDAGTGSRLVLQQLKNNVEDLFNSPVPIMNRYWNATRKLLMAGGGTLRRMDYPAFTLTCRPSISLVRLESFWELVKLAQQLVQLEGQVTGLNQPGLARWIERQFRDLSPEPLPKGLGAQIAGALERHAVAYLMLKEHVLRDALQAAPFRLRRKHIQRFWADVEAGDITLPVPYGLDQLAKTFGVESFKEALAHALLDHFKEDWGIPAGAAHLLKETLLTLLRSVAITYHLRMPWLPAFGEEPGEEDLEHTQEVASFLIQQTDHAPLELAQALLIDPQQGLPLLAGGQLTALERSCRRLVRATAGVSQKKVSGGEARVFTCRPLSKAQALDRGNLGGDCSSGSVPMRALSPHHTYYGIFEDDEQQRGYMTVYEAWAVIESEGEAKTEQGENLPGEPQPVEPQPVDHPPVHLPVLCLETINVPMPIFNAVQQDLLVIFEAIAKSRGLAEGLVLITGITTWNYQNGKVLRQSRRFRQGRPVRLYPADPASWNVYRFMAPEADQYTAFIEDAYARHYAGCFRLLAPFQAEHDPVEPENLAEAARIAALPPKTLAITAQTEDGPAGFISELPDTL